MRGTRCLGIAAVFLMGLATAGGQIQPPARPASPAVRPQRLTIAVTGGAAFPISHSSLTDFWLAGPSASVICMVRVTQYVSLGIGAEAGLFYFRQGAFGERFPGVPVEARDVALVRLFLAWRYTLHPTPRLAPYVSATIGTGKVTEAVYQRTVDGVRSVYYEIPGKMRLTSGVTLGLGYVLTRGIGFEVEGGLAFLHNDPEIGFTGTVRGGVRFSP